MTRKALLEKLATAGYGNDELNALKKLIDAENQRHEIEWCWVKGHSGHPENERCDDLARNAAEGNDLLIDEGYKP